ncbi:Kiwa anti-phage protein KwaB-like domain-containing protein [Aerococcus viridans]
MDLKYLQQNINSNSNIIMYLGDYNQKNYTIFSPDITPGVMDGIRNIIIENITKNIDIKVEEYNEVGALDNTNESAKVADFDKVESLLKTVKDNPSNPKITVINPEEIDILIYEIHIKDEAYYFIRRHQKLRNIRNRGFFGMMDKGKLNKIESSNFLGLDDKIDLIIHEDDILILAHTAFERIFKLSDIFIEKAEKLLDNNKFRDQINNFEGLKNDILNNMNYVKRVSKLSLDDSQLFLKDLSKTKEIVETFNLDIAVDTNENVIHYNDKTQAGNFINLMQDAYYKTLIGQEDGIDMRR